MAHFLEPNRTEEVGHRFLFQNNVSSELIAKLGDWSSDCYKQYILPSEALLASATHSMASALIKAAPTFP